ncbi:cytochrome b/b6 domain-containing protein [Granulosicoccus sp.]|nr:cytochrome b/b6 domain-containing protein [Granulosicoccus sp.]MDB4224552.1 cytochrome b/b6 domain-containing protein [Granulosicoccus sp.]
MTLKKNPMGYNRVQIALHWVIAALFISQFVLHDPIVAAWKAKTEGLDPELGVLIAGHVFGGITILLLAIWRIVIRLRRGVPALPEKEHPLLKLAAHVIHGALYALMILLPLTGMATWFGGSLLADTIHTTLKFPLLVLVLLHVLGALFQQFILKTQLMQRMTRSQK